MTPQELKIKRKALGLTANDIAEKFDVALRTAQRWETTHTPPMEVAEWVEDQIGHYADRVAEVMETAEYMGDVTLFRYDDDEECIKATGLSVNEHDALLGHVAIALTAADLHFRFMAKPKP